MNSKVIIFRIASSFIDRKKKKQISRSYYFIILPRKIFEGMLTSSRFKSPKFYVFTQLEQLTFQLSWTVRKKRSKLHECVLKYKLSKHKQNCFTHSGKLSYIFCIIVSMTTVFDFLQSDSQFLLTEDAQNEYIKCF